MASGWVCPECAIDYGELEADGLGGRIRAFPARYRTALAGVDDARLRQRPEPAVWSALEYTVHVVDTLDDLGGVVVAMATGGNIGEGGLDDPDARVQGEGYNERDLAVVLDALDSSAERTAQVFDGVGPEGWTKEADFPWGRRDALTMAQNAVHESHHHLMDVERVLGRV